MAQMLSSRWCSCGGVVTATTVLMSIALAFTGRVASGRSEDDMEALVEQLASPNRVPPIGPKIGFVPRDFDFDWEKQRKVHSAMDELVNMGTRAFPALVRHLEDKRYCTTLSYSTWVHRSVGEICALILSMQLEVYTWFDEKPDKGYVAFHLGDPKRRELWLKEHGSKSLAELQAEVLEWAIEQRKGETRFSSLVEEAEGLGPMQYTANVLRKSKKPLFQEFAFPSRIERPSGRDRRSK